MVDNIMDAMMDMRLRLPVAVVEHLTGGVDDAIQKLTSNVLYHVGSADVLVPSVPPLTRCGTAASLRPGTCCQLAGSSQALSHCGRAAAIWPSALAPALVHSCGPSLFVMQVRRQHLRGHRILCFCCNPHPTPEALHTSARGWCDAACAQVAQTPEPHPVQVQAQGGGQDGAAGDGGQRPLPRPHELLRTAGLRPRRLWRHPGGYPQQG